MDHQRPAIRTSAEHPSTAVDDERDTLPPSGGRDVPILDKDETAGLVSVLYHAQQGVLAAERAIDEARDANDEELAQFLEASQREGAANVVRAKRLLLDRLQTELGGRAPSDLHEAQHGRVHYVSMPDAPPSALNRE